MEILIYKRFPLVHEVLQLMNLCSACVCQILLDGFEQINKGLLPHLLLPLAGGVDHLLAGIHQCHQHALKILLVQGLILAGQLIDELQYVGVLPGNNLFTDDLQVPGLAQRCQLSILHRKLPAVLELHTGQQDLEGQMENRQRRKRGQVPVSKQCPTRVKHSFVWFAPQIADEHLRPSCGTWTLSHWLNPA